MSTPNFHMMDNFNLFVKVYETYEEMGAEAEEAEEYPEEEYLLSDEVYRELFYEDIFDGVDGFNLEMQKFNYSLTFHHLELKSGYYDGVQIYVEELAEMPHILDNEDCRYYYDMCRSQAIRKYDAEIRKINKWMEKIATQYGWRKLHCLGVFSNGEAIYQYA